MQKTMKYPGMSAIDHGGNLEKAKAFFGKKRFLDLSININPWGPPLGFWVAFFINLFKIREYPQPYSEEGCQLLAGFFELKKEYFALGNGAAELIRLLPAVLPVERGIVLEPTFSEYEQSILAAGKTVMKIPLEAEFALPLERINKELKKGDLLFICQPNNPTGNLFPENDLVELLKLTAIRGNWLLIDESFLWFAGKIKELSFIKYLKEYSNLIIINSLTKVGSIPGLRLGFMITNPEITKIMKQKVDQWSVNRLAQKTLVTLLNSRFIIRSLKRINRERHWLIQEIAKIDGLKVSPWDANFYLIKNESTIFSTGELLYKLGERGILVRDCNNFTGLGPDYLRIAVGDHRQNIRFINTLRRIINNERKSIIY